MIYDYDWVNCIFDMGMFCFVMVFGGIYIYCDGWDVLDVFQVVMEYLDFIMGFSWEVGLEKGMIFVYSVIFGNQYWWEILFMGYDGIFELGS